MNTVSTRRRYFLVERNVSTGAVRPNPPLPPPKPPTYCVECGRPAEIYDVDAGPWCSVLCRVLGSCAWCGLPPSDAEGHWCTFDDRTVWRKWSES